MTEENTDAGVVAARKQAPRSLWDPTYTETSWITGCCSGGPIRLLPRLKDKIDANYPGTRLAITEYNYGAGNHISGAIAQADVLGIFGREGLFAANLWRLAANNSFIYGAFEVFRNYDGANGSFGDTSIRATSSDVPNATRVRQRRHRRRRAHGDRVHQQERLRADRRHRRDAHRAVQHRAGLSADQRELGAAAAGGP